MVPDKFEITVSGGEPYGSYIRILLSSVLSGEKSIEDMVTHDHQMIWRTKL